MDTFALEAGGSRYPYFYHEHNCGFAGQRRTERTVELALADAWLEQVDDAWEVGAVTPYYWPGRCRVIIDPADDHALVTLRESLFAVDLTGRDVLSISTLEHIGQRKYGPRERAKPAKAFGKIAREAARFLITVPLGWNRRLDKFIFAGRADASCSRVSFLVRNADETWSPASREDARRPYGDREGPWANAVVVLEKGDLL